jgi:GTP:adenosylcobinamide-phosphate guanylyltransferase
VPVFDAILPAGGKIPEPFAGRAGTDVKALIKFGEETILHRTVRVLRDTGVIGRIVVIGGDKVRADASSVADSVLEEANSGPENILKGLKYLLALPDPPSKVFVITTDLPFLTAELLKTYIALCPANKDISVPLVSKAEWVEAYPNSSATFAKLADGDWTIGGAYLIDVKALESAMPEIEKVFQNRKSILGMAKLLGPKFLIKFVTKTLTVQDVEQKIASMLGCTGAAIRNSPTALAYDIDDIEDYEYALTQTMP